MTFAANVPLIGFEKEAGLDDLYRQFGLFQDFRAWLPAHLVEVLKKQFPDLSIDSVELLATPGCKLGGMQQDHNKELIRVQTLEVSLDLRITLRVGQARSALDIQLVIKSEGIDSTPTSTTDMFVKAQKPIV